MNEKFSYEQTIPLVIGLLLVVAIALLTLNLGDLPAIRLAPALSDNLSAAASDEVFDYERAADISAMRWQAMASFYDAQGLLTRDDFDYEQAAENSAYRWQAMAHFYQAQDLLTRDDFDYAQAAENSAYRWQAMAGAYERMGLLNDK